MGCGSSKQADEGNATVYMALYNPTDTRDPRHWAIYIDDPSGTESIQQLHDKFGDIGYRVAEIRYGIRPQRSGLWRENVFVGNISHRRIDEARQMIQLQHVDNRSQTWNCQNWAMEALAALNNAGLMRYTAGAQQALRNRHQNWQ